jgi:hypothetical protein
MRAHQLTPEVLAAFDAGDDYTLRRSLKLPPWHASPLDADLEGPAPYGDETLMRNQTRAAPLEIRCDILAAMKRGARRT